MPAVPWQSPGSSRNGPASQTSRPAAIRSSLQAPSSGARSEKWRSGRPRRRGTTARGSGHWPVDRTARPRRRVRPVVLDDRQPFQRLHRAALHSRRSAAGSSAHHEAARARSRPAHARLRQWASPASRTAASTARRPTSRRTATRPAAASARRPDFRPPLLAAPRVELRGERHVTGMPEHDLERRRVEGSTGQPGKAVATSRSGQCRSATASVPGDPEPYSLRSETRDFGHCDDPGLQRIDDLSVDQAGIELGRAPTRSLQRRDRARSLWALPPVRRRRDRAARAPPLHRALSARARRCAR